MVFHEIGSIKGGIREVSFCETFLDTSHTQSKLIFILFPQVVLTKSPHLLPYLLSNP